MRFPTEDEQRRAGELLCAKGRMHRFMGQMDHAIASGLCKPWRCEIRIAIGMDPQQRRDTLLHEVMHAIFSETALTMDFKEDDDEEKIVRRLSTGLLQVLRENPDFTTLILEK